MPSTVTYSGSVVSSAGPTVSFSRQIELEGLNLISLVVDAGKTVKVDLGADASKMQMLMVNPSVPSADLTLKISGTETIKLDQPLLLGGSGAIALLGTMTAFDVTNNVTPAQSVSVDIVVGRDPTS